MSQVQLNGLDAVERRKPDELSAVRRPCLNSPIYCLSDAVLSSSSTPQGKGAAGRDEERITFHFRNKAPGAVGGAETYGACAPVFDCLAAEGMADASRYVGRHSG